MPKAAVASLIRGFAVDLTLRQITEKACRSMIDVPGTLTLDESGLMLQAALAGAGVSYLPRVACDLSESF
jgi:DNA-binding transcriptional LysR family regulator